MSIKVLGDSTSTSFSQSNKVNIFISFMHNKLFGKSTMRDTVISENLVPETFPLPLAQLY